MRSEIRPRLLVECHVVGGHRAPTKKNADISPRKCRHFSVTVSGRLPPFLSPLTPFVEIEKHRPEPVSASYSASLTPTGHLFVFNQLRIGRSEKIPNSEDLHIGIYSGAHSQLRRRK